MFKKKLMESSREKRLFIIANHTHYLNVKNYIESHPLASNYVIIALNPYKGVEALYKKVKQDNDLELIKIIISRHDQNIVFEKYGVVTKIIAIKSLRLKFKEFDKIFLTKYRSWVQHYIVKQFKTKQTILLSDGIGIFPAATMRKKNKELHVTGGKFFIEKVLKLKPIKKLHFYSQVKMDIAENDTIEIFDFKSAQSTAVDKTKIYFIGSPLVEEGLLFPERNRFYLQQIKKYFPGCDFTYFAHRREKDEQLENYKLFGEVVRDSIIFEERMSEQQELPMAVISYFSSVLINLPQVYPNVLFYYVPLKLEDIPEKSKFRKRYSYIMEDFKQLDFSNFNKLLIE